jgi:thioredoxin 2
VRKVAEKLAGQAAVAQVNTDENPSLGSRFGVKGIPVIMLLLKGKVIDQLSGANSVEAVMSRFQHQH